MKKMRVLIMDDKPLIRQALIHTLPWAQMNCEVVGEAEDGLLGQTLIRQLKPDILISDIRMPGLSGLELADCMRKELPDSRTILITGYQQFEYALKALDSKVFRILVKPIRNEQLIEAVEAAKADIEKNLSQRVKQQEIEERLIQLETVVQGKSARQRMAGLLLVNASTEWPVQEELAFFDNCVLCILRILSLQEEGKNAEPSEEELNRLEALIQSMAANLPMQPLVLHQGSDWFILCTFAPNCSRRGAADAVRLFAQELVDTLHKNLRVGAALAVSGRVSPPQALYETCRETLELLERGAYIEGEGVLYLEEQESPAGAKLSILHDLEGFSRVLKQAPMSELDGYLDNLFAQIRAYSRNNLVVLKGLLCDVCMSAARMCFRLTGDEMSLDKGVDELLSDLYAQDNLQQAFEYVRKFILHIRENMTDNKEYSTMVRQILEYINTHFDKEISLATVAGQFGISSGYLSRLLRTATGRTFVDILTSTRIDMAKRLLRDPSRRVNEVGELVGFREYAYFYQVFKRVEGISPKEYQNQVL